MSVRRIFLPAAIVLLGVGFLCVVYWQQNVQAQKAANIAADFDTLQRQQQASNAAIQADNERLEREIESSIWNSPRQLRKQRATVAAELARHEKQASELFPDGQLDALEKETITADQAALARIDARLKVLRTR